MFNQKTIAAFLICLAFSSFIFAVDPFFRLSATYNGKENRIYEVDKNNFSPRLGFAWSPNFQGATDRILGGSASTVIRGGYSIAYDPFFFNVLQQLQTTPVVIDKILVDSNGNYSLGTQKVINRIRPTNPFTLDQGRVLPSDRVGTIFNKGQNLVAQILGPTQNPLGGPINLFKNPNPASIILNGGCFTKTKFAFLARSNTAGNLLGIDDHNNGRPIAGTPPTIFRFTGPEAPISLGCWEDATNRVLTLFFQNYRQQGNNRPQVRVTGRQFRYDNTTFNPVGPQRSYTPFTSTGPEHAFKFRFNTVTGVDRNGNGSVDAVCYVKPTTNGSDMFCRGINENSLAANTQPRKITPTLPDPKYWWGTRYLPEIRF